MQYPEPAINQQMPNTRSQHQQPSLPQQQQFHNAGGVNRSSHSETVHQPLPPPQPPGVSYNPYSYQNGMPHYYSHMHYSSGSGSHPFPVIMTDDLVSGTQHEGRMSPVRRFFLLLCTFDILFTCLLWVIAILVTGSRVLKTFFVS